MTSYRTVKLDAVLSEEQYAKLVQLTKMHNDWARKNMSQSYDMSPAEWLAANIPTFIAQDYEELKDRLQGGH